MLKTLFSALFGSILDWATSWYKEKQQQADRWNAASAETEKQSVIAGKTIEDEVRKATELVEAPKTKTELEALLK